jgi:hypothetical protein
VHTDRLADAETRYTTALDLYRQIEDRLGEANTLSALGRFFSASGADDQAEVAFAAALAGFEAIGDRYSAAVTLTYRGQHRVARRRDDGLLDWRRALDLAVTVDPYLFGQVVTTTLGDACRLLASGEVDDFLATALAGLLSADAAMGDQLSDDERGRLGLALAGLALVHDLVAIRSSGVTPGDTDRSTLRTTARRVDEATGSGFGLAALAEQVLGEASQGGGGDPLARPVVD